uniref:Nodulation signaling pathway 2-like protein n=1 Tax=Kalanchoe fedtschenkoi TaxID=63787 RepID=A0A7N0TLR5_KALFE
MAMAMDETPVIDMNMVGMEFSTYSNSTTTSVEEETYWTTSCPPVLGWSDVFTAGDADLYGLMESMIHETDSGSPLTSAESRSNLEMAISMDEEEGKGLRLVHLLMEAAEALTGNRELARVILVRLKELASPTDGTNMERLAAYFSDALSGLLEHGAHTKNVGAGGRGGGEHRPADVIAAFQLLQDMSPYVKFGHFTANQAILEAVAQERRIHILDYDIMEGIQWASLMQALVTRKEGPPLPHLRITALSRGGSVGRRCIGTVQETGRRLVAFAASIGLPLSFHQCKLDSDEGFRPLSVKLARGEALIVNCMLHLPHFSHRAPASVASFLSGAETLNPRLITLVEEEVKVAGDGQFAGRFMDTLHHYSALYDSLEAGFPMHGRARALVEKVFLGPRIAGSLARIYQMEVQAEPNRSWWEWLGSRGLMPVRFSFANHCQANLLLGLFNDGYRVEQLSHNRLGIGWKSRRLLTASIWTSSQQE